MVGAQCLVWRLIRVIDEPSDFRSHSSSDIEVVTRIEAFTANIRIPGTSPQVNGDDPVRAGREVFQIACSRCHTLEGVNSLRANLERIYGRDRAWDAGVVDRYMASMFAARPFMPPFPGTVEERRDLAEFLVSLQRPASGTVTR